MKIIFSEKEVETFGLRKYGEIEIYFQGYTIWEDKLYMNKEFDSIILKHLRQGKLLEYYPTYNGIFNLVLIYEKKIRIIKDRWGIIPLYYKASNKTIIISDDFNELVPHSDKSINQIAEMELLLFGYAVGEKTLLSDILEFLPHHMYLITVRNHTLDFSSFSYWAFNYSFNKPNLKEREYEIELERLWQKRVSIYLEYIKNNGNAVYIPFSGGLDCRLLAYELDDKGVDIFAATYGIDENNEIKSARAAVSHLKNVKDHFILDMYQSKTREIFDATYLTDRPTTSFPAELLHYYDNKYSHASFIMPGFSGDFMAGSHLKFKMKSWKSKESIVNYIVKFKSSPLLRELYFSDNSIKEKINQSLMDSIPDSEDFISAFIRWDVEQRQRRYIARSAYQNRKNSSTQVLLPFFDYELMDFFTDLPFKYLWNARLYTNTQLKHFYSNNKNLISAQRVGKKQHLIRNNFFYEYYPKLKTVLKKYAGKKVVSYPDIYGKLDYTLLLNDVDRIRLNGIESQSLRKHAINKLYAHSVILAHKQIMEGENNI